MSAPEVPCGNPKCGHAYHLGPCMATVDAGLVTGHGFTRCPCTAYVPAVTVDQAKAAVRARYSHLRYTVRCERGMLGGESILLYDRESKPGDPLCVGLGIGKTKNAAWLNAYSKLPQTQEAGEGQPVPRPEADGNTKPPSGLWRRNPETPEGKYLVQRRDGTIPEWPYFVIGAKDPRSEG